MIGVDSPTSTTEAKGLWIYNWAKDKNGDLKAGTIDAENYKQVVFWKKIYEGKSGEGECESKGAACMFVVQDIGGDYPEKKLGGDELVNCEATRDKNNDWAFCARTTTSHIYR